MLSCTVSALVACALYDDWGRSHTHLLMDSLALITLPVRTTPKLYDSFLILINIFACIQILRVVWLRVLLIDYGQKVIVHSNSFSANRCPILNSVPS